MKSPNPKTQLRHEFTIMTVLDAVRVLENNEDLSPNNPVINTTLTNLVKTLTDEYTPEEEELILGDPRVVHMRGRLLNRLSRAEAEMERFWTECFLRNDSLSCRDLESFWYWDNYAKLVDKEIEHIPAESYQSFGTQAGPSKGAAFVGAGSLPLSAIIFHLKTGQPVTCIDSDEDATRKAAKLLEKLGLDQVTTLHADGGDLNYEHFGTVFLASLIPNEEKHSMIGRIRAVQDPCFIAVRSAERLHTLLYEPFDPDKGQAAHCRPLGKTQHDAEVINTTYVMLHEQQRDLLPLGGTKHNMPSWDNTP